MPESTNPLSKNARALEALLFIYGEPLSFKKAAAVLGFKHNEIGAIAAELAEHLRDSGLHILSHNENVQLTTDPAFASLLETVVKEELNEDLTPAALETLSIIAYLGPIGRPQIDFIRGVNSSFILRALLLRGLVDRNPDPKRPNAFVYEPSFDFLRHLGVGKLEDLPDFGKYRELAQKLEKGMNPPVGQVGTPSAGAENAEISLPVNEKKPDKENDVHE